MIATVYPNFLKGTIIVPPSKSMMQRICVLALLHNGEIVIHNPGFSEDDKTTINVIESLGAVVTKNDGFLRIASEGKFNPPHEINFGESGLACRMFAPILALSNKSVTLNGKGTLLKRDMSDLMALLSSLDVTVNSSTTFLPFEINGPINLNKISIDGSKSSQYITGVIIACAYSATSPIELRVYNPVSSPYLDLTLNCLKHFGYQVQHNNYEHFTIKPKIDVGPKIELTIESDWSSAAYFLVAGSIAGNLEIKGLDTSSVQADAAVLKVLHDAKADVEIGEKSIMVRETKNLQCFHFDATHSPDLFPILVCLAAFCEGQSSIKGLGRLYNKESNRMESILDVFGNLGVDLTVDGDVLHIKGKSTIRSCQVSAHHDHRMAMSAAITALRANGPVTIHQAESVKKSFPDFFKALISLGATVSLTH
jgi:3-phosphoshikimate 1-carboxyvinyltransferase